MPLAELNGARHYYRLEGSPSLPLLVLLHPIGADQGIWDRAVPHLLARWRVLRHDLRGHGGSDSPGGDYSLSLLADDLMALADHVGADRFVACGISIGAMVAMQAARAQPQRVRALVVSHAAPYLPPPPNGGWDARAAAALAEGMAGIAQRMAERQFTPAFRATHDPVIDTTQAVCARMDPRGYAGNCAVLRDADLRPVLGEIDVPALVIAGSQDPMLKLEDLRAMAQAMPNARFAALDGGHLTPVEMPEAWAREVLGFLETA